MLAVGVCLVVGAPTPLVFITAAVAATSIVLTRPVHNAIVPEIADSPAQITAGNSASSTLEGVAVFLGPLLTGVLLELSGPGSVFLVLGTASIGSALITWSLPLRRVFERSSDGRGNCSGHDQWAQGAAAERRRPPAHLGRGRSVRRHRRPRHPYGGAGDRCARHGPLRPRNTHVGPRGWRTRWCCSHRGSDRSPAAVPGCRPRNARHRNPRGARCLGDDPTSRLGPARDVGTGKGIRRRGGPNLAATSCPAGHSLAHLRRPGELADGRYRSGLGDSSAARGPLGRAWGVPRDGHLPSGRWSSGVDPDSPPRCPSLAARSELGLFSAIPLFAALPQRTLEQLSRQAGVVSRPRGAVIFGRR